MLKKQLLKIGLIIGLLPATAFGLVRKYFNFQNAQELRKNMLDNVTDRLNQKDSLEKIYSELVDIKKSRTNWLRDCLANKNSQSFQSLKKLFFRVVLGPKMWKSKTPISNKYCSETLGTIYRKCAIKHPKKTWLNKEIIKEVARIFSGKKRLGPFSRIRINRIITKEKKKLRANRKHSEL